MALLDKLRSIVQAVNQAKDFHQALCIIVRDVANAIGTEACSIYLIDNDAQGYRLVASVGFREGAENKVILKFGEGIVGLVAERGEPINLEDASEHPRFRYFPETGEEKYEAFLGVPVIHQRRVLGIIVAQQQEKRKFHESEEAFLVTVSAQLSGVIAHAQSSGILKQLKRQLYSGSLTLNGIGASPGLGVGQAVSAYSLSDLDAIPDKKITDKDAEREDLKRAIEASREEMQKLSDRFGKALPADERVLFDVYLHLLNSNSIQTEMQAIIEDGFWAPTAVRKAIQSHIAVFDAMADPYFRERGSDLRELGRRILLHLSKKEKKSVIYPDRTILVGRDLTAAHLAEVPTGKLVAVVAVNGSRNAHVAILARAMGIPAAMGVSSLPVDDSDGCRIIVDGYTGEVRISPSDKLYEEYLRLSDEEQELYAGLEELRDKPAMTPDGHVVPLLVNTGLMADIRPAVQAGAEGVGLYRTEVPFMIRERFPTEEEQYHIYRQLLDAFAPASVTIRTLDVGGDKPLPYFPQKEDNPYMGCRGIRLTLDHPEIFLVQLRALLRANEKHNTLKILLPMVSQLDEIRQAKRFLKQAHEELLSEGYQLPMPDIGVMIEVPSAVYQAEAFAKEVDFVSVGSNDLIQYLLAVDRNNPHVANLYDSLHPAVLRALHQVVSCVHRVGKKVSICGEMAADPLSAILLLGLQFDTMSLNAHSLPAVKWVIRKTPFVLARKIFEHAYTLETSAEVRAYLEHKLEPLGLGRVIRVGR